MSEHKHNVTSNTHDVFRTFIGCRVKGFLKDVMAGRDSCLEGQTLIFDCGWGFTVCSNGSHWTTNPPDVRRVIERLNKEYQANASDIADLLTLAGEETP